MGLILDSSVVIAAERRGDNVTQMLKQIAAATGDQRTALSSIGLTGLVHGIYRAQAPEARSRRESFIHELLEDVEVYPYTKETAMLAGKLDAEQRSLGVVIPFGDLLIGRRFASGVFLGDRQREALPANPRTQGRPAVNSHLDAQSVLGLNPSCYRARYYDPIAGRFLAEDSIRFSGGLDFYRYGGNSPIDRADPLGLFAIRDGIIRHSGVDIDPECGASNGGACTLFRAALVLCNCISSQCGKTWKAEAELRIYGDMYVYSGPFPYKGRRPRDGTVHDAASAIAHEYNVHINPAIAAVTPLINALEAKTFDSKGECQSECDKTSGAVNRLFRQTLRQTQDAEENQ